MQTEREFKGKRRAVVFDLVFADADTEVATILERHGISLGEYVKWLSDDAFLAYVSDLSERVCASEMTRIARKLISLSKTGDTKAVKILFDFLPKRQGDGGENSSALRETIAKFNALDREIFEGAEES